MTNRHSRFDPHLEATSLVVTAVISKCARVRHVLSAASLKEAEVPVQAGVAVIKDLPVQVMSPANGTVSDKRALLHVEL